jgi:signal transduction histidine kinase
VLAIHRLGDRLPLNSRIANWMRDLSDLIFGRQHGRCDHRRRGNRVTKDSLAGQSCAIVSRTYNGVLTFRETRKQVVKREFLDLLEFDVSLMLNTVLDQFGSIAQEKHINIKRIIPPRIRLKGDESRLIQVFFNLMDNAVKFTGEGGVVTVSAEIADLRVLSMVEDTVPGIPVELHPRIFDRFYRMDTARNRKQGGFGLGLAIAKHIVDLHGGTIYLDSKRSQGAKFVITLLM